MEAARHCPVADRELRSDKYKQTRHTLEKVILQFYHNPLASLGEIANEKIKKISLSP